MIQINRDSVGKTPKFPEEGLDIIIRGGNRVSRTRPPEPTRGHLSGNYLVVKYKPVLPDRGADLPPPPPQPSLSHSRTSG